MKIHNIINVFFLILLIFICYCDESTSQVVTRTIKRGNDVDFLCVKVEDKTYKSVTTQDCDKENDSILALITQSISNEIFVIDLTKEEYLDFNKISPLYQGIIVGPFPYNILAVPDKGMILVLCRDNKLWYFTLDAIYNDPTNVKSIDVGFELSDIIYSNNTVYAISSSENKILTISLENNIPEITSQYLITNANNNDAGTDNNDATLQDTEIDNKNDILDAGNELDAGQNDIANTDDAGVDSLDVMNSDILSDITEDLSDSIDIDENFIITSIAVSSKGDKLFIASNSQKGLIIFNTDQQKIEQFIETSEPIKKIAAWPIDNFLYILGEQLGNIYVIDLYQNKELSLDNTNPLNNSNSIQIDGIGQDLIVIEYYNPDVDSSNIDNTDPSPETLYGIFGVVLSSDGKFYIINGEDQLPSYCWIDRANKVYDENKCRRHIVRPSSDIEDLLPHLSEAPQVIFKEYNTYLSQSSPVEGFSTHPWFSFTDETQSREGYDEETYMTYGIFFDWEHYWRQKSEQWNIEYEGSLPDSYGRGGNIENPVNGQALFKDRAKSFCSAGILAKGDGREDYAGDVLVITSPPSPLFESVDCVPYMQNYTKTEDEDGETIEYVELEYRIVGVYNNNLIIEQIEDGPPLPNEDCFPYAVEYYARGSEHWIVTGSYSGFLHKRIVGQDNLCIDMPDLNCTEIQCNPTDENGNFNLNPINFTGNQQCLLNGRAWENEVFANPFFCFDFISAAQCSQENQATGTCMGEWELKPNSGNKTDYINFTAYGGSSPIYYSIGQIPVVVRYNPYNNNLYFIDQASVGLVEFNLEDFTSERNYY